MKIGILALQGAFAEHEAMLDRIGIEHFQIRCRSDLDIGMDGIILPGGESTVMGKLLTDLRMIDQLRDMISSGLPVMGTCAGLILLAEGIANDSHRYLATFPMVVRRNAFGRQLGSFSAVSKFGDLGNIPMEFIRAPVIDSVYGNAEILSEYEGRIVAAKCRNQLVTAFHPELTDDITVHRYFVDSICNV